MRTEPAVPQPDTFYEAIITANEGRSLEDSLGFALRLVLLLANQIDDQDVLMAAVHAAAVRPGDPA